MNAPVAWDLIHAGLACAVTDRSRRRLERRNNLREIGEDALQVLECTRAELVGPTQLQMKPTDDQLAVKEGFADRIRRFVEGRIADPLQFELVRVEADLYLEVRCSVCMDLGDAFRAIARAYQVRKHPKLERGLAKRFAPLQALQQQRITPRLKRFRGPARPREVGSEDPASTAETG